MKFIPQVKKNKGSSLLETLIYMFIFGLLSLAVTNALISLTRSYALIRSSASLESVAEVAMERISRDTRESLSVDFGSSVFDVSPGVLYLNTKDQSGLDMTLRFFLSSGAVHVEENGTDLGPLSTSKATITRLVFTPITTVNSKGIKIELSAEAGTSTSYKTRNFYTTAVLRGSYAQ